MGFSVSQGVNSVTCQRLLTEGQLKAHRYTTFMFLCTLSHHAYRRREIKNIQSHASTFKIESAKSLEHRTSFLKNR